MQNSQIEVDAKTDIVRMSSKKKNLEIIGPVKIQQKDNNKCNICESTNQFVSKCPDKGNAHDTYHIIFSESNRNTNTCFKNFTGEAFGTTV